jgi:hypothetical protein
MTCARQAYRRRGGPCCCWRVRFGRRHRQCSHAQPRGAHYIITLGGRRPRTPRWHLRCDQSRRRAIWGLFLHGLVKSTSQKGKGKGGSGRGDKEGRAGGLLSYFCTFFFCGHVAQYRFVEPPWSEKSRIDKVGTTGWMTLSRE